MGPRTLPYGEGREALIAAAMQIVGREGLTKLTYRSLASEAQVSHGAIQHHFKSIDHIIEAALRRSLEISVANFSVSDSIDDFFAPLARELEEHTAVQAFQADVILEARRHPRLRRIIREHQDVYREYLVGTLTSIGIFDEDVVELLTATADGIIFQRIALGEEAAPRVLQQVRALQRVLDAYRRMSSSTTS